jgi:hypothetical protein
MRMIRDPAARIAAVRRPAAPVIALAAALLAAVSLNCAAAPFSVRIGQEKIALDAPPGFTDTGDLASPRLQDLAMTLTSESNRVLLFGLTDADLRRFTLGDPLEARRYVLVVTAKAAERERIAADPFEAVATEFVAALGPATNPPDLVKYLEGQPIGKANLLGELRRAPGAVSVLQAMRLPPLPPTAMFESSRPQYQVFSISLLLVQGKVLRVSAFSLYAGPADLEWLKATTLRWVDDLRRLSPR